MLCAAHVASPSDADRAPVFRDRTKDTGVRFVHRFDIKNAKMLATQGGGAALADYDGDGRLDIYMVGSVPSYKAWRRGARRGCGVLWHNEGNDARGIPRFRDVTAESGISACGWGQGATWVDIDGDGDPDLFQTNAGTNQLFINRGPDARPRFEDRSAASGLGRDEGFFVGAGFFDADHDGDVDVFVAGYLDLDLQGQLHLSAMNLEVPADYGPAKSHFYLNQGDGTFVDRTAEAGFSNLSGKGMSVAPYDLDKDGWTDLYVADDSTPNALFHNNHDGTFVDVAVENGCAYNENGLTLSGMGLAIGDFDRNGWPDVFVTNYAPEWNTLYRGLGEGRFEDATGGTGLGPPSLDPVGWGTGAIDYDNDGLLDLYVNNGNILPRWLVRTAKLFSRDKAKAARYDVGGSYRQSPQLFRGRGDGTFEDVSARAGDLSKLRLVGRGSAAGDLDGDGDQDLVLVDTAGFPLGRHASRILLNEGGNGAQALGIRLVPGPDRRTVLGARVLVETASGIQMQENEIPPSYASGSDTPLWFGLAQAAAADITISWPDGRTTHHSGVAAGHIWRMGEDGEIQSESRFHRDARSGTF